MEIKKSDENYFCLKNTGERITLSDQKTRLVIEAGSKMYVVKVDDGIIKDSSHGIKKSDYLTAGLENQFTHLIELKGAIVEAAYKQLQDTIKNLENETSYGELVKNREYVDAYIVSPNMQDIPRGINRKELALAKILAQKSRRRSENILDHIHYVKVVPNAKNAIEKNNRITCSGKTPLVLP